MAGQQFSIGQIIFILSNKTQSVVPAIVAEEDVRKIRKLDGVHEVTNYKLSIGPKNKQQLVDINRIDGQVFGSLEEIKKNMTERLTQFIDNLVKTTEENVFKWYGVTSGNQVIDSNETDSGDKFDPEQIIQAVNGNQPLQQNQNGSQFHSLQIPGGAQNTGNVIPGGSLRDNIRNMVAPEGFDPRQQVPMDGTQFVIMPDGTRIPVNLNQ